MLLKSSRKHFNSFQPPPTANRERDNLMTAPVINMNQTDHVESQWYVFSFESFKQ